MTNKIIVLFLVALFSLCLQAAGQGINVLIVVTSYDGLLAPGHYTGYWGEELFTPYEIFKSAGFNVTLASPKGGRPPLDPASSNPEIDQLVKSWKMRKTLDRTIPLSEARPENYDAMFIVGGHGVLFDLVDNRDLARVVRGMAAKGKVISAVCHGLAALVNIKGTNGLPILAGHEVTGFSAAEEKAAGLLEAVSASPLKDQLESRLNEVSGGGYSCGPEWLPKVTVSGNFVTGQNPGSSKLTALTVKQLLTRTWFVSTASKIQICYFDGFTPQAITQSDKKTDLIPLHTDRLPEVNKWTLSDALASRFPLPVYPEPDKQFVLLKYYQYPAAFDLGKTVKAFWEPFDLGSAYPGTYLLSTLQNPGNVLIKRTAIGSVKRQFGDFSISQDELDSHIPYASIFISTVGSLPEGLSALQRRDWYIKGLKTFREEICAFFFKNEAVNVGQVAAIPPGFFPHPEGNQKYVAGFLPIYYKKQGEAGYRVFEILAWGK
ncbi:MAG: type 1 glutamine amidotransferase domain-containing protein [Candidatus Wallbacteria bacterium]|nr:type 1 glutamine amidotransferase domain-containing protein [Candidatus Wallbacteria bacterium]